MVSFPFKSKDSQRDHLHATGLTSGAPSRQLNAPTCCLHWCAGGNGAHSSNGSPAAPDATLVLEGQEFRDFVVGPGGIIDKAAFTAIWPRLRVLARCSPTDKYTIVSGALLPCPTSPCHAASPEITKKS